MARMLGVVALAAGVTLGGCYNAPEGNSGESDEVAATPEAELEKITLTVPDMVCPLCARTIEHTLEQAGLRDIAVDLEKKLVTAKFDPDRMTGDQVRKLVTDLGYTVSAVKIG